jgi:hypothetical protein
MAKIIRNKGNKYRSGLEVKVANALTKLKANFDYETEKIPYTIQSFYNPDFVVYTKSGNKIYIEAKGEWDSADRRKHLALRQQRPGVDIRFIFTNPDQRISKGSKSTYRDICEGRGTGAYKGVFWKFADSRKTPLIPKEWLDE